MLKEYDNEIMLYANAEGHVVKIEMFHDEIHRISCDCFYWSDNWIERNICRHIASTILRLNDIEKNRLLEVLCKWHAENSRNSESVRG